MIGATYLIFAAIALGGASAAHIEEDWVLTLLKRQEPGTPAYACHSSCGNAITASRGADPCTDSGFLEDYAACLACAGPDDINIWRYYGATLTVAGTKCGLSTTPGESTPPPTSSTSHGEPEPETTTSSTPVAPTPEPVTGTTESTPAATTTPDTTLTESSTVEPIPTTTPSGSTPTASGNGTATTTSIEFTGAANSQHQLVGMGALGAAVLAILV